MGKKDLQKSYSLYCQFDAFENGRHMCFLFISGHNTHVGCMHVGYWENICIKP